MKSICFVMAEENNCLKGVDERHKDACQLQTQHSLKQSPSLETTKKSHRIKLSYLCSLFVLTKINLTRIAKVRSDASATVHAVKC